MKDLPKPWEKENDEPMPKKWHEKRTRLRPGTRQPATEIRRLKKAPKSKTQGESI